ncbi:uracil phosphoribosyltransferase [Methanolobus sp.]|uniref:uracil phosphoribosyltransferase n=1 Tax=Methanolobus sp. TaxID=1874737 RepID=UPI0025D9E618|nr:uracil phosphoribosyltransferase [Methanolobus sp.]
MITSLEKSSKAVQILSTQSRRADINPVNLKEIHRTLGQLLSYEYVNSLDLHPIEICHVQGLKKGMDIAPHEFTLILTMMRSGLYVADGFREILGSHSRLEFIDEKTSITQILSKYSLKSINVVIVDSVINTGNSIKKVIDSLPGFKSLTIVCQVMHSEFAQSEFIDRENIHFITCRISQNFYVGSGKTDTGNRLFGFVPRFNEDLS